MIFGFFFVEVPTAAAIFLISAVGSPKSAFAVVAVVSGMGATDVAFVSPVPLGMSAVLLLPPQAARPMQAAASASPLGIEFMRITARSLAAPSPTADRARNIAAADGKAQRYPIALQGAP